MEPGEGDHVDGQLPQVGIELAGEPEAGGEARHGEGNQVIEIPICWSGDLH